MHNMLNEFYKYIANNTIGFFQSHQSAIRPGERYCLRLDTEEMVASVDQALRQKTLVDGIQGNYQYGVLQIKVNSKNKKVPQNLRD